MVHALVKGATDGGVLPAEDGGRGHWSGEVLRGLDITMDALGVETICYGSALGDPFRSRMRLTAG